MMSERSVKTVKDATFIITWGDIFASVPLLLEKTESSDVRWCHVERMQKYYEAMCAKYEEHRLKKVGK